MRDVSETGQVMWTPPADARQTTQLGRFLDFVRDTRGHDFPARRALWVVVSDLEGFWGAIWDFFGVRAHTPYERVLGAREMPGAEWFTGATLNYAEHMVGTDDDLGEVAVVAHSQTRAPLELTFGDLREQVAAARAGLRRLGVGPGDRVVAYMPNIPETLVAFLAAASLGAVWATCAPEFGPRSVIDRFGTVEPKVMLAIAGYRTARARSTAARRWPRCERRCRRSSMSSTCRIWEGRTTRSPTPSSGRRSSPSPAARVRPGAVRPSALRLVLLRDDRAAKAIVHRHGGILVEHLKNQASTGTCSPAAG